MRAIAGMPAWKPLRVGAPIPTLSLKGEGAIRAG